MYVNEIDFEIQGLHEIVQHRMVVALNALFIRIFKYSYITSWFQLMNLPFDALQECPVLGGEQGAAAPCGVHMQPEAVPFAHFGDLLEGIERAQHRRAGGRAHHERLSALRFGPLDFAGQMVDVHAAALVHLDVVHVVRAEAQERGHLLDGVVRVLRGEEDEAW